mmetsp:Transcript_661/g.2210  ORF Transcript_661/g.2210 Transcript_661/m.2210 type:complete len:243 (+) Transcript_661:633-1361(+)
MQPNIARAHIHAVGHDDPVSVHEVPHPLVDRLAVGEPEVLLVELARAAHRHPCVFLRGACTERLHPVLGLPVGARLRQAGLDPLLDGAVGAVGCAVPRNVAPLHRHVDIAEEHLHRGGGCGVGVPPVAGHLQSLEEARAHGSDLLAARERLVAQDHTAEPRGGVKLCGHHLCDVGGAVVQLACQRLRGQEVVTIHHHLGVPFERRPRRILRLPMRGRNARNGRPAAPHPEDVGISHGAAPIP